MDELRLAEILPCPLMRTSAGRILLERGKWGENLKGRMLRSVRHQRFPMPSRGGITMEAKVRWETEMKGALARARAEKRPVLVDFFNPG